MKLSDNTLADIDDFFSNKQYGSKSEMIYCTQMQLAKMLSDSGFVYISTRSGHVIHKDQHCGYGDLVHIEQAIRHGYKRICKQCAAGTRVEDLFWERMNKLKEK